VTGVQTCALRSYTKSKKNSHEEVADDLITQVFTDYEYEDILNNYYHHIGDNTSIQRLATSEATEEDLRQDLLKAFEDEAFQTTHDGRKFLTQIEAFLQEQKRFGVDSTITDLQYGLSQLNFEEGSTIQPMDTEAVL